MRASPVDCCWSIPPSLPVGGRGLAAKRLRPRTWRPSHQMSCSSSSRLPPPEELTRLSERLADAAGEAIRPYFRCLAVDAVDAKPDETPVTAADRAAETAMRELLQREVPDHAIVGEEFGTDDGWRSCEYTWVLDPIDGTKAFITGKPTFGTLIALMRNGVPVLGIIDQPISKERWIGVQGRGSTLNSVPITSTPLAAATPRRLGEAILHCTHPDMFHGLERMSFEELSGGCKYTLYGSDCYAYALLAGGHVHVICEADMKPWDYMALVPVIQEAGGVITDWRGRELGMDSDGTVLAAVTDSLHMEALELLQASPKGILLLYESELRAEVEDSALVGAGLDDSFPAVPPTEVGASSMSGFGTGSANRNSLHVKVDIKSLNGRFFDLSMKAPRWIGAIENELRTYLRQHLQRGSITVKIEVKDKEAAALPIKVDEDAVRSARELLLQVNEIAGLNDPPTLEHILRFSEVFVKRDSDQGSESALSPLVREALEEAVEDLKRVRRREGYALQLDLLRRCNTIEDTVTEISKRVPGLINREKENVRRALEDVQQQPADLKLLSEMETMAANRADISEEVVRLRSHLSILKLSFFTSRPVGQKMNFLVQEINREAVSLGTKANDAPIAQLGVVIREELEKIREQVQNIV